MSNDFHSLLSVFRDATSTSSTSGVDAAAGGANRRPNSTQSATQTKSSTSTDNNSKSNEVIDPTSTKDPSFSAPLLKERIERILRVQQIRKSTTTASTKPPSKVVNDSGDNNNDVKSLHIAICATIVDNFPHETLWRKWMDETGGEFTVEENSVEGSGTAKINEKCDDSKEANDSKSHRIKTTAEMYVHAKNPERVRSEWLRSKTLPVTHRPNWNDVRIVRAILSLIEAALRDEKTTHILLCTESCIPVATLKEVGRSVLLDEVCNWEEMDSSQKSSGEEMAKQSNTSQNGLNWDRSYIDCYDRKSSRCTRFDEHNCWDIIRNSVPGEAVYKALPGWCFLSRKHAQSILDLPSQLGGMNLWVAFERVWAPEEVFIPTALAICGHMEDEVSRRALTHSQWDERAANHKDRAHPLSYDGCFDDKLVERVRRDGCLFMRKLKRPLDVSVWEQIIVQRRRGRDTGGAVQPPEHERNNRYGYNGRGERYDRSTHQSRSGYDSRSFDSRGRHDNGYQSRKRERDDHSSYHGSRKQQHWRR